MQLIYDSIVDAAYLRFSQHPAVETEEIAQGIMVDFDAENRIVGIEILNAKARVARDGLSE